MKQKIQRVIWAVDAFSEDKLLQAKLAHQIKTWAGRSNVEIEPVTLLAPNQLGVSVDIFLKQMKKLEAQASKNIEAIAKKAKLKGLLNPRILFCNSVALRAGVQTLLDYAKETDTDLIALSTQSRKGVSQFLFGSFAETLVLNSSIPTYLVTPKTHAVRSTSPILFATDLSPKANEVFKELLIFAKESKQKVTVFNRVEYVTQYAMSAFDSMVYADYQSGDTKNRKQKLEALVQMAEKSGVKASWVMDDKSSRSVYEAIVDQAKKQKAGMIAMASQTGPVVTNLLGSTTRQVLRFATCPVWVLHSKNSKATK